MRKQERMGPFSSLSFLSTDMRRATISYMGRAQCSPLHCTKIAHKESKDCSVLRTMTKTLFDRDHFQAAKQAPEKKPLLSRKQPFCRGRVWKRAPEKKREGEKEAGKKIRRI